MPQPSEEVKIWTVTFEIGAYIFFIFQWLRSSGENDRNNLKFEEAIQSEGPADGLINFPSSQ